MRRNIYISVPIVVIIISFIFWWNPFNQEKVLMDSLLLHQPIKINQIKDIYLLENGTEIKKIPTDDYTEIVNWFNQYDPTRISEEKIPSTNAQIVIESDDGKTITINYLNGNIYIGRTDIKADGIEYVFLDDAPKLESYFKNHFY